MVHGSCQEGVAHESCQEGVVHESCQEGVVHESCQEGVVHESCQEEICSLRESSCLLPSCETLNGIYSYNVCHTQCRPVVTLSEQVAELSMAHAAKLN